MLDDSGSQIEQSGTSEVSNILTTIPTIERDLVQEIADFIGPMEGCCKLHKDGLIHAYLCPAGYPTQGYGLLVEDLNVPPITKEEAFRRFKEVIPFYIKQALYYSPILLLYPDKLIAIVSFIYNLGPAAYAGSTLRKKINSQSWIEAANQIKKWNKGGGKVLPGLIKRRTAEAVLLLKEA